MKTIILKTDSGPEIVIIRDAEKIKIGDFYCILSNMTGDLGHIIAALNLKEKRKARKGVLIISRDEPGANHMLRDLESNRFDDSIVVMITPPMIKEAAIALYGSAVAKVGGFAMPPSSATKEVSQKVRGIQPATPLRKEWVALISREGEPSDLQRQIEAYCFKMRIEKRAPLLCVWTRHSGKPTETRVLGGANPQFDSSSRGTAQICDLTSVPCQKLLIGPRTAKAVAHVKRGDVVDLGEYWREPPFAQLSRLEQAVLFYFLMVVWECPLVHVGMKSGQMDSLVLWGQPTVFIEDIASPTTWRSKYWVGGIQKAAFVQRLPTRTGQALRRIDAATSVTAQQWDQVAAIKKEMADEAGEDRGAGRGFDIEDLQIIDAQIVAAFASMKLKQQERPLSASMGGDE